MSEKKRAAGTRKDEVVTREYTINLHKRLHGWYRLPTSLPFPLRKRVHFPSFVPLALNKAIWTNGIRSVPRRVRVRIARKRNDEEDAKEELYSLVTVAEIPAEGLKGLGTKVVEDDE
ncbi:hypothetical protein ABZP36_033037 [Zizania latifolia]